MYLALPSCILMIFVFARMVWLVAVIIGSPMWHVQRLEVDSGLGLVINHTIEMSSLPS